MMTPKATTQSRGAHAGSRQRPTPPLSRRLLRAFTLMEVMIAVGALAVLAVAIAAVFEVTGRTVTSGRRTSALSAYANLIEQQMRKDFAALSREGALVIRHQHADYVGLQASDNPVYPDQDPADARPRRADEIVFFIKGQFTSAREPIHPQLIPSADAARIYYGHGQAARDGRSLPENPDFYWRPSLLDTNQDQNARLGANIAGNPNRYAADWTLLRHTTLLIPRGDHIPTPAMPTGRRSMTAQPQLYRTPLFPNPNAPQLWDSPIQVAGQPAAFSIFRSINWVFPLEQYSTVRGNMNDSPRFTSGLVDIAACSLHEIRNIITASTYYPWDVDAAFYSQFSDGYLVTGPPDVRLERAQAWMEDLFPSENHPEMAQNNRRRVRYETLPANLVGSLQGDSLQDSLRRADQAMLASWGFLPHCTEFIVEWSWGRAFPSDSSSPLHVTGREGELIWHGLDRTAGTSFVARPYRIDAGGTVGNWSLGSSAGSQLIHGYNENAFPAGIAENGPLLSYFGYFDPGHTPSASQPTRDWPWPRYLRVTLSLADPRDPSQENSFQFIFDVPQR